MLKTIRLSFKILAFYKIELVSLIILKVGSKNSFFSRMKNYFTSSTSIILKSINPCFMLFLSCIFLYRLYPIVNRRINNSPPNMIQK